MARAGRAVSSKADRLSRLARAQEKLVKAIEMQVQQAEQRALALNRAGKELDDMAVRASAEQPSLLPKLLRRLAEVESNGKQARNAVEELQLKLLAAKFREKAISNTTMILRQAQQRKAAEVDTLETVQLMTAKASGKRDVLI